MVIDTSLRVVVGCCTHDNILKTNTCAYFKDSVQTNLPLSFWGHLILTGQ